MPSESDIPVESLRAEVESLRSALARTHRLSMLGTLAGSIAHEFNNLLTPVKCYAEMALEAPGDRALTAKALERAQHGCDRASRIASAILAFAGERSPRAEDHRADVARAVQEALLCLAQDPGRMGVELELRIDPDLRARMDQTALQQVILNLVLNAIKAMRGGSGAGGGRLAVRAWHSAVAPPLRLAGSTWNGTNHAGQVAIEITDTGCGIEPSRLPHVFDAFVTTQGGTGLGLTICKQLVEGAGGSIAVSSQLGHGTKFTITLPVADEPAQTLRASA